jgi:hypothetical protein
VARALIDAVGREARIQGAGRFYLHTQDHNTVARGLYDKVGKHNSFIRYELNLP